MSITTTVQLPVEDITTALVSWTSLKLYRSTTPDGTFTLVTTITLVAATRAYSYSDTASSAGAWYRYSYYNTGTLAESAQSDPWQVDQVTLDLILKEILELGEAGWTSTCSALGSTTTLIDLALVDFGVDTKFAEGGFLYRPSAANAGDKLRRVTRSGFTVATGTLTVVRPWAVAPASAEVYYLCYLFPPYATPGAAYTWARAVQDGLSECYVRDRLYAGVGDGSTTNFDLGAIQGLSKEEDVASVWLVWTPAADPPIADVDVSKRGRYWSLVRNGPTLTLVLDLPPTSNQEVWLDASRTFEIPFLASDTTSCPLRLAARAALWKGMAKMQERDGKYAREEALALRDYLAELSKHTPVDVVAGV